MSAKPRCQCCEVSVGTTVVFHKGETAFVSDLCWREWQEKPNGPRRMLQMVRAHKAALGTPAHDLALLRMYIEGNYDEYGGDEELAALDRVEVSLAVETIITAVAVDYQIPRAMLVGTRSAADDAPSRYEPEPEE